MTIEVSTDRSRIDDDMVFRFLHDEAYWCRGIGRDAVETALARSVCFGAYDEGLQVGFARVVSDHATFAYLCDVFVLEPWRARGVGKALMRAVMEHPSVTGLRRVLLATLDAHGLYESFGFRPLTRVERWMAIELTPEEAYGSSGDAPWRAEGRGPRDGEEDPCPR